jgi:large subunit ribosomal protein L17
MFRNMLTSLFRHEKITTTQIKAKELRRLADKLVTLGKAGGLHSIRQVASVVNDPEVVTKIFKTIAPRFADRAGGYTRVVKIGRRLGDGAEMCIIELLEGAKPAAGKKEKGAKEPAAKKAASKKTAAAGEKKAAAPRKARKAKAKAEVEAPAEPAAEAPAEEKKE